ncbi:atrial natriuretic peptide receptor 2-like [Diprion similis]|uniref:atrial natriuretic peptide receptor 2-like n=1 Tax=Diprion similis TaxID=362088 RepID=UPI001EF91948|nr:atrial natriuretic peptide receptor 2-like [Diprion similis]XP_046753260.1 atrial natriuretic peptide receptor 2-like [Diprion similis]
MKMFERSCHCIASGTFTVCFASRILLATTMISALQTPMQSYNVGVLMASHLDSPFDLERCGPAVDLALAEVNEFLTGHNVQLQKVQGSYPSCSGARAPGLAADMHFRDNVIAFIGPACAFALEPVARLAAYWNSPIITGMGDQPPSEGELSVTSGILGRLHKWRNETSVRIMYRKPRNVSAYSNLLSLYRFMFNIITLQL